MATLALLVELLFHPVPHRDLRYEWVVGQADWYTHQPPWRADYPYACPVAGTDVHRGRLDRGAIIRVIFTGGGVVRKETASRIARDSARFATSVAPGFLVALGLLGKLDFSRVMWVVEIAVVVWVVFAIVSAVLDAGLRVFRHALVGRKVDQ